MKLRNLEIFVAVMEHGSLAQAADRLATSQPAASRLIKLLEQDLNLPLFERRNKRLVPTPHAEHLLPEARRILASVEGIPSYLESQTRGERTPYRVVCHMRVAESLVIPALVALSRLRPDLRIHMDIQPRRNLERLLAQEQFDAGVGVLPISAGRLLKKVLCEADLEVFLARGHAIARDTPIGLGDLASFDYVGLPKQTTVRRIVDDLPEIAREGLTPVHEFSTSSSAHRFVAATTAYTFSDRLAVCPNIRDRLKSVPFRTSGNTTSRKVRYGLFGTLQGRNPDVDDQFSDCIQETAGQALAYQGNM